MERSIELSEKYENNSESAFIQNVHTIDWYQKIPLSYITSPFFLWVVLILIMNRKNWKRPIMLLLIVHWMFRSTGDLLNKTFYLNIGSYTQNMYIGYALANIFWCCGEIIGDWYPLIRTRAIINHKKKIRIVYVTCAFYNLTKICSILYNFYEISILLSNPDEHQIMENDLKRWTVMASIQIGSFLYDLSVILCLKQNLFDQLNHCRSSLKNTFTEKFKRISEFRIFLSMAATLTFLPIILIFIFFIFKSIEANKSSLLSTETIENIRRVVIDINFNLIYIDQILLKYYASNNNNNNNNSVSKSETKSNFNSDSKIKTSQNKIYRELTNYNKLNNKNTININNNNNLTKMKSNETLIALNNIETTVRIDNNSLLRPITKYNYDTLSSVSSTTYFENISKMNNNESLTRQNKSYNYDNNYHNTTINYNNNSIHNYNRDSDNKIIDYYNY